MPGTRFIVDSDGDVETNVPQPVYEFISAPQLTTWEQSALITWYRGWNHYKDKIQQRRLVTGEDYTSVISTVKGAVKPEVLQTMARFLLKEKPTESVTTKRSYNSSVSVVKRLRTSISRTSRRCSSESSGWTSR